MNAIEVAVGNLAGNMEMLKRTVEDLSDADLLIRPVPGANHGLWQLGHLAASETFIVNTIKPGVMPELPAGFAERFQNKTTNNVDDPAKLAPKAQIMELLIKARQGTIAFVKTLTEADLDKPSPERFQKMMPKLGNLIEFPAAHLMMHLGQLQVLRRKLNKPIIF
jgi:hypothetical protein